MAGGAGSRLRPLTCGRPKPIVPIMNKPVMEYIIELLKKHGITQIGVTLQYLPQMIKDTFGDGSEYGVQLEYFVEDQPLGTAGSVKNADEFLDDTFIVISGDALTDIDLEKAIAFHKSKNTLATLILKEVSVPLEYGVVVTNESGKIIRFLEKPSWGEVFSNTVNTGIYILEPESLKYFNKGQNFDFSKDLFPMLMSDNKSLYGYVTEDYWCDVGDIQSYIQAHIDILEKKVEVNLKETQEYKDIYLGSGVEIDSEAIIKGPCVIGDNCKIAKGVKIQPYTILGANCIIDSQASLKRTIAWNNATIGNNASISGAILCFRTNIKSNVTIYEEAVIGDDCQIKERSIIKPNIKLWPNKIVETASQVQDHIIWGTRYSKTLFGKNGITGQLNVDITPEFVSKLATAYGSILKNNAKVAVSADNNAASLLLKYSAISGILASGIEVLDLGQNVLPIIRNTVSSLNLDGALHISYDNNNIRISFIESKGININRAIERKIENVFITGDFKRADLATLKQPTTLSNYNDFYFQSLLSTVNKDEIKKSKLNIAIGSNNDYINELSTKLLKNLNCNVIAINTSNIDDASKLLSQTKFDLGVIIDNTAEHIELIDDSGRIIKNDLYTAIASIISVKSKMLNEFVVPITTTSVVEKLASSVNAQVTRTKTSQQEVMEKTLEKTNNKKKFILNYDAFAAMTKIINHLVTEKISLSALVESVPQFFVTKKDIECPWDSKGKVMRNLIQENQNNNVELFEGVKIYHDGGWVLVLPDADEPVCTVYSEGNSSEHAQALSDMYVDKIREMIG